MIPYMYKKPDPFGGTRGTAGRVECSNCLYFKKHNPIAVSGFCRVPKPKVPLWLKTYVEMASNDVMDSRSADDCHFFEVDPIKNISSKKI